MVNVVVSQIPKDSFWSFPEQKVSGTCISRDFISTYLQLVFILHLLSAAEIPQYPSFLSDSCRLSLRMLLGATGREENAIVPSWKNRVCCCFVLSVSVPVITDFTGCETAPWRFRASTVLDAV